jgi:hypothetical protein
MKNLKQVLLIMLFGCFFQSGFSQVGINTATPLSTLDINGNLSVKVVVLNGSGSATLINDGVYISVNPQVADQEFQLPSAVSFPGRVYMIRNISQYTAKLTSAGGVIFSNFNDTYTGMTEIYMYTNGSTDAMTVLKNSYRNLIIISDGTNWTVF